MRYFYDKRISKIIEISLIVAAVKSICLILLFLYTLTRSNGIRILLLQALLSGFAIKIILSRSAPDFLHRKIMRQCCFSRFVYR